MNDTVSTHDRLYAMHMNAESRARALQAAYVGEVVSGALAGIGKLVSRLVAGWREWSERRQALAYLERLDERLLADIGLSHATLHDALRHSARKPADTQALPSVDAVIDETVSVAPAANQDQGNGTRRHAA